MYKMRILNSTQENYATLNMNNKANCIYMNITYDKKYFIII